MYLFLLLLQNIQRILWKNLYKSYKEYADDIITANVIDMGGYVPEVNEYLLTKIRRIFRRE